MRTHFPRLLFGTFLMSLQPDTITSTTRTRDGRTRDGEHDGYCCTHFTREFYYFCCASPPTACNSVAKEDWAKLSTKKEPPALRSWLLIAMVALLQCDDDKVLVNQSFATLLLVPRDLRKTCLRAMTNCRFQLEGSTLSTWTLHHPPISNRRANIWTMIISAIHSGSA